MGITFCNPFDAEGRWFKGNLHTHSTMSDGSRTCEQLVDMYKNAGYDFLSITDHGVLTDVEHLRNKELLLIPGEEICVGASGVGTFFHVVGVNIRNQIPCPDFHRETHPQKAIDMINDLGGMAIIAHPYWSGLTHRDLINLKNYAGVEIYNTTCDIMRNLGSSASHIDGLLAASARPLIFATDDHHGEERELRPLDALKGWIMVKAQNNSVHDIMSSIRKGLFYSSMGPEIRNVEVDGDGITVETSPVKTISFVSTPALGDKFTAEDEPLSTITRPGREGERYVRIEVTDYEGRSAWSNPLFLEN
jgi:hypothetical protein